jgi:lipopolysaccharide/colanic/teichoic acid biosynthesis glycosyltransferase
MAIVDSNMWIGITSAEEVMRVIPRTKEKVITVHKPTYWLTNTAPILKRPFDIFLSGIGLILSSWLWVLIWTAIIIEDGFPILIRQKRVGRNGGIFNNYKFRSMKKYTLREKIHLQATEHDSRVTNVGRFLRKCALDELPQLLNIFKGDMSFVGPRALLALETETWTNGGTYTNGGIHTNNRTLDIAEIPGYEKRITVKPGLTGIAQIFASRDIPRRHKFKYDLLYIRKMSFLLDLKLIFISFLITFNKSWEKRSAKLGIIRR